MKIKNIMLVYIVLLAILTIGAVSASNETNFNETLTVNDVDEVSCDTSDDDYLTNSSGGDIIPDVDSQGEKESSNDEHYRDADYFVYTSGDEFKFGSDDNLTVFSIILKPDTADGRFVISDGNLNLFDENITNETVFVVNGDGSLKFNVKLGDLNLMGAENGDEITFMFYDGEGNEVEIYTTFYKIRRTYGSIQFYSEEDPASNFIYVSHLEFITDKNSSRYSGSYIIGGIVLDSQTTSGRFVGLYGDREIFSKPVDLNNGWHKDSFNNIKAHLLLRDLNLTDVNDNDDIIFTFYNGEGVEVESLRKIMKVQLTNSSVSFYEPFSYWLDNFESISNDWASLCEFYFDGRVENAVIFLTVMYDEGNIPFTKTVEDNMICWQVNEIFHECGTYHISLAYSNGHQTIDLVKNSIFQLVQLNINELNQDVCVNYPYDVLRIYDNEVIVEVYVNGEKREYGSANPFTWTLRDLNITKKGDYEITVLAYDEENQLTENITYTLNVIDFDGSDFKVFASNFEVLNLKESVVRIYCPEDCYGNIIIEIKGNIVESEGVTPGEWMNYTLENLGIEENGVYETVIYNNGNEILRRSIDVWKIISKNSLNCWVSSHESCNDLSRDLCNIWFADYVTDGTLIISIRKSDGTVVTDEVNIEDIDQSDVQWRLEDFDIFDEVGLYTINLTYTNEDKTVFLAENHEFTLTQLCYDTREDVYIAYPFDVIRFYNQKIDDEEEYVSIEVSINGNPVEWGGVRPFRWTLKDLNITEAGQYDITVKTSDNNGLIEEFTYTLNVDNDTSNIQIFSNGLGVKYWEVNDSVLYLVSPEENIGDHLTLTVNENPIVFTVDSPLMNWTLEKLGIDCNGGYDIKLFDEDGNEIASAWLNVECYITEENFDVSLSTHSNIDDSDNDIVNVWADENVGEGIIYLSIRKFDGTFKEYNQSIEDSEICWTLEDLDILDEAGVYQFNVVFKYDDVEIVFVENCNFYLTQMYLGVCEGEIYINYPFDVLRIDSLVNGDDEGFTVKVYVNGNPEEVDPYNDDPLRWTLKDLGITETGENTLTVKLFDEDGMLIETLTFTLDVYDEIDKLTFIPDQLAVRYWGMFDPILYLMSPEDYINQTFTLRVNGEEYEVNINSTIMNWTLNYFNIKDDGGFDVELVDGDDNQMASTFFDVGCFEDIRIEVRMDEEKTVYTDSLEDVIYIKSSKGTPAIVYITVNGETIFTTRIITDHDLKYAWTLDGYNYAIEESKDYEYYWDLKSLGIADEGDYNITVKVVSMFEEKTYECLLHTETFNNDTFRARSADDEKIYIYFFAPTASEGNIEVIFHEDGAEDYVHEYPINESFWNKWTMIEDITYFEGDVVVKVNGEEISIERYKVMESGNWFEINDEDLNPNDTAIWVYVNSTDSNCTINITGGSYTFIKKVTELGYYEWQNGVYRYAISLEDLDSFSQINDRDEVKITLNGADPQKGTRLAPTIIHLKKADGIIQLFKYGELRIDLVKIQLMDDEDENYLRYDVHNLTASCVKITVPDYLNITDSATITVVRDNYIFTKKLTEFTSCDFDYECLGNIYYITLADLNVETLKNHEVINISLISNGETIGNKTIISYYDGDDIVGFEYFQSQIELIFHYGEIGNTEFGQGDSDGNLIILTIPKYLNVTEGTIKITADDGTVLYSKLLSEFGSNFTYENDLDVYKYLISDSRTEFDYSCIPEDVNFTVSFTYEDKIINGIRGIRIGDMLYRINTPKDVAGLFKITVADRVLCDGEDNVITIAATDHANRMSIVIDIGGGCFVVYVNGVKVEDLGRLIRVDDETELELYRLYSNNGGNDKLKLYLSDLNITENGVYEIRVAHIAEYDEVSLSRAGETEIFKQNITLTSNVKSNYQNSSVEWLTGYGLNPDLLYLDTYYGQIDEVNGTIVVLNSNGEAILTTNIKDLPLKDGRRYLRYSDFTGNFGDNITIRYCDGNERNGQTVLDVLWRNVTSEDFTPEVKDNVEDYYANFIALNIPDLINEGQIIVTIRFKNNMDTNISDMNVTKDFDSQAVYRFNIADIKANYGSDFVFSLFDLNFFEDNGNYDVDVKFTADNVNMLNITDKSVNVEFLKDVIISINETSRYGMELPFASVKIFEPLNAYGELYVDGKLYSHKPFEKGLIIFTSSTEWAPGNHSAEIKVFNSEFGSLLNSSARTFETLTRTGDVNVYVGDSFRENENATFVIQVPQSGVVYVQVDGGKIINYTVTEGNNTIDLGVLSYGNHTIWIIYENENGTSYYNNHIIIFIGDDGSWVDFPDKIVLNDEDVIKINVGEGAEGYILVYIDGRLVENRTLVNGSAEISLTRYLTGDNIYGLHNYTILYYDSNGNLIFSRNGTFTVAYIFKDNIDSNGVPLQEYYVIVVNLPPDATGYVRITINNYTDTQPVVNGQAVFIIEGLPMGEYDVFVEYLGDDKYPPSSYHTLMNVSYYGVFGDFLDGRRIVSLILPENATGNLVVYNDNRKSVLTSVALVNGKARIDLSNVSVGIYEIRAYYDGSDYEVKSFSTVFRQMPDIYITQNVVMGDDVNIYMDLDNSTGDIVITMDGLSPVVWEIINGKVNYTFSTEGYSYGNHTVNFFYFGNSFDGNIFFEDDGKTKINYILSILPKTTNPDGESNGDTLTVYVRDNVTGEIAYDATGTITFYINGIKYAVVEVVNGIATLDISSFKNGRYLISWVYSGDNKYGSSSKTGTFDINNEAARIVAADANIMYLSSGKYSVTVYKADGSPLSGGKVTFLINGKVYKTVTTDSKGVASVVITHAPGSYKITSQASGASVTKTLKVTHVLSLKKVKVKRSAKKLVLKATLKKVNGKYLKNNKITFKFNGKKFKAKTNKKGIAKVTIKQKVLKKLKVGKKVKYQATYKKDTVKYSIKVK